MKIKNYHVLHLQCTLVKLLTAEAQSNKEIFKLIDKFFEILTSDNWIKKYIFWELELLRLLVMILELKIL